MLSVRVDYVLRSLQIAVPIHFENPIRIIERLSRGLGHYRPDSRGMGLLVSTSLVLDLFGTGISDDSSFLHQELLPGGSSRRGGRKAAVALFALSLLRDISPFLRGE